MIDKSELLLQGKHFGRVFLDYLCELECFSNGRGGISSKLADELVVIGQSEQLTEKDSLSITNIRNCRDGKHKIPYWLNLAALILACENEFKVEHAADAIALIATVLVTYTEDKHVNLDAMALYIEQRYHVRLGEEYYPMIQAYLESRHYTVTRM